MTAVLLSMRKECRLIRKNNRRIQVTLIEKLRKAVRPVSLASAHCGIPVKHSAVGRIVAQAGTALTYAQVSGL